MKSKYKAVPVEIDGHRFASKKEGRRYATLKLMERAGEIYDLEIHPSFKIKVTNFQTGDEFHVCTYIADFAYKTKDIRDASPVVIEDVKGVKTDVYKIKKKLMRAVYGIDVKEV